MSEPQKDRTPHWYQKGRQLIQDDRKGGPSRVAAVASPNTDQTTLRGFYEEDVATGASSEKVFVLREGAITLTVTPETGGTATVEYSISPIKQILNGTATWEPAIEGTTEQTAATIEEPVVAIRCQATDAAAHFELRQ